MDASGSGKELRKQSGSKSAGKSPPPQSPVRRILIHDIKQEILSFFITLGLNLLQLAFLGLLFWGVGELVYVIFKQFTPRNGAIAITVILTLIFAKLLMNFICRMMVFPGSFWYTQRMIESNVGFWLAKNAQPKIELLLLIVNAFSQADLKLPVSVYNGGGGGSSSGTGIGMGGPDSTASGTGSTKFSEIRDAKSTFDSLVKSYEMCQQNGQRSLSHRQQVFYDELCRVRQLMTQATVQASDGKTHTFEHLLDNPQILVDLQKASKKFTDEKLGLELSDRVTRIKAVIDDIADDLLKRGKLWKWMKRWLTNDTIGSLKQCRSSLCMSYKARALKITTRDNKTLDAFFVYGNQDRAKQDLDAQQAFDNATVIYCCPNAGIMEFSHYSSRWVYFYTKKRINVVLWNYRGYGLSEGTPDTHNIRQDGECVVDYVRAHLPSHKLGAHGQSLGGMVAVHIAREKKLDFVMNDRSFNSLSDVISFSMGGEVLKFFFRAFTSFDKFVSDAYLHTPAFKVLASDPRDRLIIMLSQLQNGVCRKYFSYTREKRAGAQAKSACGVRMKKMKNYLIWTFRSSKRKFYHSKAVLALEQQVRAHEATRALHTLLARLDAYYVYEEVHAAAVARGVEESRHAEMRDKAAEQLEIQRRKAKRHDLTSAYQTFWLECDLQALLQTPVQNASQKLIDRVARASPSLSGVAVANNTADKAPKSGNLQRARVVLRSYQQLLDEATAGDRNDDTSEEEKAHTESTHVTQTSFNTEVQTLARYLSNLLNLFDFVDASGIQLCHCTEKLEEFQQFLINIYVIGSVCPQEAVAVNQLNIPAKRALAILKIDAMVQKVRKYIQEQSSKVKLVALEQVFLKANHDAEELVAIFATIRDNLLVKFNQEVMQPYHKLLSDARLLAISGSPKNDLNGDSHGAQKIPAPAPTKLSSSENNEIRIEMQKVSRPDLPLASADNERPLIQRPQREDGEGCDELAGGKQKEPVAPKIPMQSAEVPPQDAQHFFNTFGADLGQQLVLSNGHNSIYTCAEFRNLEMILHKGGIITQSDVRAYSENCNCITCRNM